MDKCGQDTDIISVSGKRLRIARNIKSLRLKDLANTFDTAVTTIQKWQIRGIPNKTMNTVCNLFGVEEWVFSDEFLPENNFKEIISNPALQKKYHPYVRTKNTGLPRWINSYKIEHLDPKKRTMFRSHTFHISCKTVLIRTKLWNVKGADYILVSLNEKYEDKVKRYGTTDSVFFPKDPEFSIWTNKKTKPSDVKIEDNFIHNVKDGNYYLYVYCKYKAEINVYEMETYPVIKKTNVSKKTKRNELRS
ncbi:MAG: hypothetical protein ABSF13_07595 [Smithella sp.]|jgi:hypothetical protein